jgi:hypothetical protein
VKDGKMDPKSASDLLVDDGIHNGVHDGVHDGAHDESVYSAHDEEFKEFPEFPSADFDNDSVYSAHDTLPAASPPSKRVHFADELPSTPIARELTNPAPTPVTVDDQIGGQHGVQMSGWAGGQMGGRNAISGASINDLVQAYHSVDASEYLMSSPVSEVYEAAAEKLVSGKDDPEVTVSESLAWLLEAAGREEDEDTDILADLQDAAELARHELVTRGGPVAELIDALSGLADISSSKLKDVVFEILQSMVENCMEDGATFEEVAVASVATSATRSRRALARSYLSRLVTWFVVCIAMESSYRNDEYGEAYESPQDYTGGGANSRIAFAIPLAMSALAGVIAFASCNSEL